MDICVTDICITDTCTVNTNIMDTCIMDISAWVTRPERPKSRGPKGVQREVGARRAPSLLYAIFSESRGFKNIKYHIQTSQPDNFCWSTRPDQDFDLADVILELGSHPPFRFSETEQIHFLLFCGLPAVVQKSRIPFFTHTKCFPSQ